MNQIARDANAPAIELQKQQVNVMVPSDRDVFIAGVLDNDVQGWPWPYYLHKVMELLHVLLYRGVSYVDRPLLHFVISKHHHMSPDHAKCFASIMDCCLVVIKMDLNLLRVHIFISQHISQLVLRAHTNRS